MIASMTGFGREVQEGPRERIEVEVRSVNSRSLKVSPRLAEPLLGFETEVENVVRERIARGTVHVQIDYRSLAPAAGYELNVELLKKYARDLAALRDELGLAGAPIEIDRLALLPGAVVEKAAETGHPNDLWARVRPVLERALASLVDGRKREGAAIEADLRAHRREIGARIQAIRRRIPEALERHKRRLHERLRSLLAGTGAAIAPEDLAREVALFADRTDVSEELSRLEAHLDELDRILDTGGPVGRRLEFLSQEMMREANTTAAKSQDAALVEELLALKLEVDRVREQVANVE